MRSLGAVTEPVGYCLWTVPNYPGSSQLVPVMWWLLSLSPCTWRSRPWNSGLSSCSGCRRLAHGDHPAWSGPSFRNRSTCPSSFSRIWTERASWSRIVPDALADMRHRCPLVLTQYHAMAVVLGERSGLSFRLSTVLDECQALELHLPSSCKPL